MSRARHANEKNGSKKKNSGAPQPPPVSTAGSVGKDNSICQLTSPQDRQEVLEEAAYVLARREEAILPTFGGRAWKVEVEVKEDGRRVKDRMKKESEKKEERNR